jgi:hypothetical protein
MGAGRLAGPNSPYQGGAHEARQLARLRHGRHVGQAGQAPFGGDGEPPHLPLADGADGRAGLVEEQVHIAGEERGLRAGLPAIGHMGQVNPCGGGELRGGKVGGGAVAGGGVVQLAGIGASRGQ